MRLLDSGENFGAVEGNRAIKSSASTIRKKKLMEDLP